MFLPIIGGLHSFISPNGLQKVKCSTALDSHSAASFRMFSRDSKLSRSRRLNICYRASATSSNARPFAPRLFLSGTRCCRSPSRRAYYTYRIEKTSSIPDTTAPLRPATHSPHLLYEWLGDLYQDPVQGLNFARDIIGIFEVNIIRSKVRNIIVAPFRRSFSEMALILGFLGRFSDACENAL